MLCVEADVTYTPDTGEMLATVIDNGESVCSDAIGPYNIKDGPREDDVPCFERPDHHAVVRNMGSPDQWEIFYSPPGAGETLSLDFCPGPDPIEDKSTGKMRYRYGRNEWC